MDIIHLLPDSVANQIAAGEVIQRPASCLKELVENSLDAGASRIQVIVRDAGRTLLQVIDDGSGMSETDVRMAFERHATSKINTAQDLFALRTMGFRGEALASICAVAQVEVQSRREEDEMGTLLHISASKVESQEPCQCPVGTSIKVKNLFYNVPVRRKFLKTDQTELRNLLTEFYHIVLVYPKVQFTFVHNDEIVLELPVGTEKQRIEAVFGKGSKTFTGQFVDIRTETEIISIHGFIGKPEAAGKNTQQYFFVNGRYMRHPYFHKAVMTAYSGMLAADDNPSYFIYFDIAPEFIDVNIHPTKTEIKFQDEQMIFQILLATVRESLGKFNIAPSLDFNRDGEKEMPIEALMESANHSPHVVIDPNYNPFRNSATNYHTPSPKGWEQLYTPTSEIKRSPIPQEDENPALFDLSVSDLRPYSYGDKYLLLPSNQGLLLIHRHRAHICLLFTQFMAQITTERGASQQLLFPEVIDVAPDDVVLVESIKDDLQALGFDIEQFSKNSYTISGIPAMLDTQAAITALNNIIHTVRETGLSAKERWKNQIALSLAKDAAVQSGKKISDDEAQELVRALFDLPQYMFTPDGKKVISILSDDELQSRFGIGR